MAILSTEVKGLIRKYNPKRADKIIEQLLDRYEQTGGMSTTCIDSFTKVKGHLPEELNVCFRAFHSEKICPYIISRQPCRF